jgi:hypothetical protein
VSTTNHKVIIVHALDTDATETTLDDMAAKGWRVHMCQPINDLRLVFIFARTVTKRPRKVKT